MNEQIKELAEQADIFISKSNCAESGNGTEIIGWHIEKFAKLIIKECANQIKQEPFNAVAASAWIKEHFGVE